MISIEQFHKNIWEMFFSSKKTLDEALAVYENMSIETKSVIAMLAFKRDKGKMLIDKDGKEKFELILDAEELEHFTLTCMLKEKQGWFEENGDVTNDLFFSNLDNDEPAK